MVGIMVGMMVGMMVGLAPGLPSLSPFIYTGFRRSMVGMLGLLRKKYFLQYFVVFCLIFGYKERNDYLCSPIKTHPNFT
jgi:hypothetical protein